MLPGGQQGQGVVFQFEGRPHTLEMDFAAIAAFERVSGQSLPLVVAEIEAGMPKVSHVVWLLSAALRKHHPELAEDGDRCLAMLADKAVVSELFGALNVAMPDAAPGESAQAGEQPAAADSTGTN